MPQEAFQRKSFNSVEINLCKEKEKKITEFNFIQDGVLTLQKAFMCPTNFAFRDLSNCIFALFRRNRFEGEPAVKKSRPAPNREGSGFERYPKNFETVRRPEPPLAPPPRAELRDTDRRERDDRRPVPMHERPMGVRATIPNIPHNRSPRDGGHGWKDNDGVNTNKGDIR